MAVIYQMFILFSLMVIGFAARKFGVLSHAANGEISRLILKICMPAFILSSMNFEFSADMMRDANLLIVMSFIVYGASIIISKIYSGVTKPDKKSKSVIEYVIIFSNSGFMGYPVIAMALGDKGVFYAAMYNLSFNVVVWTYGALLFSGEKLSFRALKHLVQPATVAIVVGYVMFISSMSFPAPILSLLKMVGGMTTPLSMMFIGAVLTEIDVRTSLKNGHVYMTSAIRLLLLPFLTYLVLTAIRLTGYTLMIPVIITGMPAAVNTAILASDFGADYKMASLLVFISTLFSMVTIPLMIQLVV